MKKRKFEIFIFCIKPPARKFTERPSCCPAAGAPTPTLAPLIHVSLFSPLPHASLAASHTHSRIAMSRAAWAPLPSSPLRLPVSEERTWILWGRWRVAMETFLSQQP